ncbi:hypothetical protein KKG45_04240 [bacterium]|nr:hypothetical protein [bacterium]MBU1072437.1 hypothetical protein [bacterium]MBU1675451.1 hypothetical protein [bacterium]
MNYGTKNNHRCDTAPSVGRLWLLLVATLFAVSLSGCSDEKVGEVPQTPFPEPDIIDWVFSIWGSGPDDVFMVGRPGFILHFDGGTWTRTDVAASTLTTVWGTGPSDVYACGHAGALFHFDGTAWSRMDSGTDMNLYDVGEGPYGEIYTVGHDGVLKKLSGGSWVSTQRRAYRSYPVEGDPPVEQAPEDTLVFRDSIDFLTAISAYGIAGNSAIVLMENNHEGFDHEWEWGPVEDDDFSLMTSAVSSITVDDNYLATDTGKILRLTATFDGYQWVQPRNQQGTPRYPSTFPARVTDLWLDEEADLLYLTTWTGRIATMQQDGSSSRTIYADSGWLSAIWGTGSTNIYAAGYGGVVLHFDGNTWEPVDVPLPDTTAKEIPVTDKFGRPLL